jgi:RimJ/RimL family protein N-acetyltransferase
MPSLQLRLFNQTDALHVSQWIVDPQYETFFRNNSILPTFEECATYPAWANNLVMMVIAQDEQGQWQTIGMVNGYYSSLRNQSIHAGILLTVEAQKKGFGSDAMTMWVDYLFRRIGMRMVILELVDPTFIDPLLKRGFVEGGRIKEACKLKGEWSDEYRMYATREMWRPVYGNRD